MRPIANVFSAGISVAIATSAFGGTLAWKAQFPSERMYSGIAYDSSRHIAMAFGGQQRSTGQYVGDTWVWSGTKWAQREVPGPSARSAFAMAYDSARGVTVLFGGKNTGGVNNETWEWNGVQWSQRIVAGPPARSGASMSFDSTRNVMVLFGGFTTTYLGDTWEWDGTTWTQRAVTGPAARTGHALGYDSVNGKTVLYGGLRGSPVNGTPLLTNDTWTWDGTTWVQEAATGPKALQFGALAFDSSRGVSVLFGGATATNGATRTNETWEWNGSTWTKRANGGARSAHAMTYMPENGGVLIFGGGATASTNDYGTMSDLQRWDGVTAWTTVASRGPRGRSDLGMTYNSVRQTSVVTGGYYSISGEFYPIGDAWEWNGTKWVGVGSAPELYRGATTFDSARGTAVYFGGEIAPNAQIAGDTYEWHTPGSWVNRGVTGPSPRVWSWMVFDSMRNVSVLFGGGTSSFFPGSGDTWEWNGTTWTERAANGPTKRYGQMMAYDSARGVTVLFGGMKTPSQVLSGETWEWDGNVWTQHVVPGPTPRWGGMMAYDAARGKTVLFGGSDGTFDSETWEWDGAAWTQVPITGATGAFGSGMVYDPVRRVMVLFGGQSTPLPYSTDTWELQFICPGDINTDFVVDDADFGSFAGSYDTLDCADPAMALGCPADLNGDHVVDDADFTLFAQAYDALLCY